MLFIRVFHSSVVMGVGRGRLGHAVAALPAVVVPSCFSSLPSGVIRMEKHFVFNKYRDCWIEKTLEW
jgi:hypothetical protein